MNLKQFNPMKILNYLDLAQSVVRGDNPYPISFEVDPSNACNHDCVWCMYEDLLKNDRSIIPRKKFHAIIDEIIQLGTRSITFTGGGEPLTNPETIKLIPYIKHKGVSVALITNGGLLDREECKVIVENLSYIRISIDAGCSATHAKLHQNKNSENDNYEKIIDNVFHLVDLKRKLKKDLIIGIGYLVHPENTQEIFSLVAKMKEIGADYVQIRPICTLTRKERQLITKESKKQIEHSLKLIDQDFHVFPILHRFDEILSIDRGYDTCYGHALIGIIGADCKVYLCCQLKGNKKFILGDLNKNTFKEIWNGQKRKDIIRELNINYCPPCRYNKYNEILEYIADKEKLHTEFL